MFLLIIYQVTQSINHDAKLYPLPVVFISPRLEHCDVWPPALSLQVPPADASCHSLQPSAIAGLHPLANSKYLRANASTHPNKECYQRTGLDVQKLFPWKCAPRYGAKHLSLHRCAWMLVLFQHVCVYVGCLPKSSLTQHPFLKNTMLKTILAGDCAFFPFLVAPVFSQPSCICIWLAGMQCAHNTQVQEKSC